MLRKDIDILKAEVTALREDVDILKVKVAALREDIDILKEDMKEVKADIVYLKADIIYLKFNSEESRHYSDNILDEAERVHKILDMHKADKEVHTA